MDRTEIEGQMRDELNALDISINSDVIQSVNHLKRVLYHDNGRGKRGVFITLIHKFQEEEMEDLKKKLQKKSEEQEKTIRDRENIIGFIDEGHRTQYGILASEMRDILANAFFFAFTGTPIAKKGRDTFRTFTYEEENYLDKYFIRQSQEDGFTVPISYQARLEDETHAEKDSINYFLEQELEEIPERYQDKVSSKIRKKLSKINVMLKNPERVELVTKDIANHFLENLDDKFKGMVVTADREACMLYKKKLDKYLPPEYSEVVMSFNSDDPDEYLDYLEHLKEKYNARDFDELKDEIRYAFKEEEYPKLLIVTNMFLTGFDAPILQTMYLDKPLKEHRLLQAIARTNRPFDDVKETGLIMDYVGIFDEYEKTMKSYTEEDIQGAAYKIDKVKEEFLELLEESKGYFTDIPRETDRETLMKAISRLKEDNNGQEFQITYKKLRKKFELLGPNPFKAQYLEEFKWLSDVYYAYSRHVNRLDPDQSNQYVQEYFDKTLDFIHEETDIDDIREDFPIIEFDEDYIERLEEAYDNIEDRLSDAETVPGQVLGPNRNTNPATKSIADRVEEIIEEWNSRKRDLDGEQKKKFEKETYGKLKEALGELGDYRKQKEELGFDDQEYYLFLILEKYLGEKSTEEARELSDLINEVKFPNWRLQQTARKGVKRAVRKYVRKLDMSFEEREDLYEEIVEMLEKTG